MYDHDVGGKKGADFHAQGFSLIFFNAQQADAGL
jgi:hypothetical protein